MRVPPVAYGGTELVVSLLTEELVRLGHDVTLFASGDSETTAKLVPGSPRFLRGSGRHSSILTTLNVLSCVDQADHFDIIHNHTFNEGMAFAGFIDTPMLTTLHGAPHQDEALMFEYYKGWYNTISKSSKALLPPKDRFAGVVYNSIDVESYPFTPECREDYLVFLSRISVEKGPHLAIEVAKRLGRILIIAGNVNAPDMPYFEQYIRPEIDDDLITFVGEVDYAQKRQLLSRAHCLLAPITWEEPFGLFMIEAMACGVPVIALRRGAAPELVRHGVTGFVVDDVDAMAEAVSRVQDIDPYECRRHVAACFSVERMTQGYLDAYQRIIERANIE